MPERRFWWCIKGHLMGEIGRVRTRETGATLPALYLYEQSVASVDDLPVEMPVLRGRVIGDMLGIPCTICKHERDWFAGEDSMARLLARVRRRKEKL